MNREDIDHMYYVITSSAHYYFCTSALCTHTNYIYILLGEETSEPSHNKTIYDITQLLYTANITGVILCLLYLEMSKYLDGRGIGFHYLCLH